MGNICKSRRENFSPIFQLFYTFSPHFHQPKKSNKEKRSNVLAKLYVTFLFSPIMRENTEKLSQSHFHRSSDWPKNKFGVKQFYVGLN